MKKLHFSFYGSCLGRAGFDFLAKAERLGLGQAWASADAQYPRLSR
jgi:hypothetical protein